MTERVCDRLLTDAEQVGVEFAAARWYLAVHLQARLHFRTVGELADGLLQGIGQAKALDALVAEAFEVGPVSAPPTAGSSGSAHGSEDPWRRLKDERAPVVIRTSMNGSP